MKLSIVIPVHNNWNFTKACLNDLSKLSSDHEVLVVDNGSEDDTKNIPKPLFVFDRPQNFGYIRNESNLGFAKASNQGFACARGEIILFLNNDIRVQSNYSDWTKLIIDAVEEDYLVGPTGGLLDKDLNFISEINKLAEGNFYMSGWCLSASKITFKKLMLDEYEGPFTEEFTTYFEDTDLSFRAKELGIKFKIVDVPVVHFGKITSKKLNIASLYLPAKRKFIEKWKNKI